MSTVTRDPAEEVFVPAEELADLFREVGSYFRDRCGLWCQMLGHSRIILLLAEHPTKHLFWLMAPVTEGQFLAIWPWSDEGKALVGIDEDDWPERVPWKILARLPFTLAE